MMSSYSCRIDCRLILACYILLSNSVNASEFERAPMMKPMLLATESEVVKFDSDGDIVWRTPSGVARDVWQLENGNVLFPFNQDNACGVREVTSSGKTKWEFKLAGQYVISCQRMKNGNTLVGASCQGKVLVVNPDGEVVHAITVRAKDKKHCTTVVRETDTGNVLVVEESTNYVTEYRLDGRIVWEFKTPFRPFGVERLKNGNTLISGQKGIVEVSVDKRVVWHLTSSDVRPMGPRWFAGFRVLKNGNIVVCNPGGAVPVFEVNRAKEIVWHARLTTKQVGIAHGIFVLPNEE